MWGPPKGELPPPASSRSIFTCDTSRARPTKKAPARQRTAASTTARSPAGLEPGAWDRPWTGARSPPATRPRPTAPAPCAPRFHCSGAARLSCANRAHSVRKRGPTVFLWCGRPDLQRIWRPRPRNPPQLFRLVRQYPAAEPPPIDRYCTFDHEKKEEPAVRSVGKNGQTVAFMVRKALIAAQPAGNTRNPAAGCFHLVPIYGGGTATNRPKRGHALF